MLLTVEELINRVVFSDDMRSKFNSICKDNCYCADISCIKNWKRHIWCSQLSYWTVLSHNNIFDDCWETVDSQYIWSFVFPTEGTSENRSRTIPPHFNPDTKSNLRTHYKEHIERICDEMGLTLLLLNPMWNAPADITMTYSNVAQAHNPVGIWVMKPKCPIRDGLLPTFDKSRAGLLISATQSNLFSWNWAGRHRYADVCKHEIGPWIKRRHIAVCCTIIASGGALAWNPRAITHLTLNLCVCVYECTHKYQSNIILPSLTFLTSRAPRKSKDAP